jgi:DASH complex subunit DAD1
MSQVDEDPSFFDKERDKLSAQITSAFEELLLTTNVLNRKVEEVLGMTREYETISALWQSFHELMRSQPKNTHASEEEAVSSNGGPGFTDRGQ